MLPLSLLVFLLTHRIYNAHVTHSPHYVNRLDRLYEKLEKLTIAPDRQRGPSPEEKLYEKLDRLNSLSSDKGYLSAEDEDLLSAMRAWGQFSAEQLAGVERDLQRSHTTAPPRELDQEYGDSDWNDEDSDLSEGDYPMDGNEEWYTEDSADTGGAPKSQLAGVAPQSSTRLSGAELADENALAAAVAIVATNARPRIIASTPNERAELQRAALVSTKQLLRNTKCVEPQPRWLTVRQLAPAADTVYMPPCVRLHRCAPDAGCCINESDVCAPVDGSHVELPLFLQKADGSIVIVKMQFFNHTRCACVSRDKLRNSMTVRMDPASFSDMQEEERPQTESPQRERAERVEDRVGDVPSEGQNDWRSPTEGPIVDKDEEVTAPPQLRRCTCPGLFLASMSATEPCSCVCSWAEGGRRRDCQSLARGKEHFGLRDRVCVARGDCTPPTCEFGAYDRASGKCPVKKFRRLRFHGRGRFAPDKTVVV